MPNCGMKFGLVGPASSLNKSRSKATASGSKPSPRRRPSGATAVFEAASDEEGNRDGIQDAINGVAAVNKRLAAISAKQEQAAKKEYEKAMALDPSVYDYDHAYDGMKESRESNAIAAHTAREKEKRKPKYIGNLLKQAKLREVESDRIFERKLQKEREEQDKLEGEATMKFVTSAYKKKLMEQKKWELQQKLEEEKEERDNVSKTGMAGFYSNLITKNIAMGGDVEESASSAFTTGSKRHAATELYDMQDSKKTKMNETREEGSSSRSKDESEGGPETPSGEVGAPSAMLVDPKAKNKGTPHRHESHNPTAVRASTISTPDPSSKSVALLERDGEGLASTARRRNQEVERHEEYIDTGKGRRPHQNAEGEAVGSVSTESGAKQVSVAEEAPPGYEGTADMAAAAKAKKQAAIKAARERFLARKKG